FFNIERIDLTTADYHVNPDSTVTRTPKTPSGYLLTRLDCYKLSDVEIEGGRLSFTTENSLGVSYRFEGRVLADGLYPVKVYEGYSTARTIMVEGRITRFVFGLKVAESDVQFTEGFGC
nr:hypothetical protein [Acidobacteriota bacterium]